MGVSNINNNSSSLLVVRKPISGDPEIIIARNNQEIALRREQISLMRDSQNLRREHINTLQESTNTLSNLVQIQEKEITAETEVLNIEIEQRDAMVEARNIQASMIDNMKEQRDARVKYVELLEGMANKIEAFLDKSNKVYKDKNGEYQLVKKAQKEYQRPFNRLDDISDSPTMEEWMAIDQAGGKIWFNQEKEQMQYSIPHIKNGVHVFSHKEFDKLNIPPYQPPKPIIANKYHPSLSDPLDYFKNKVRNWINYFYQ